MELIVKPLSPEIAGDYFDFFENRAFTDDSPYRCYCQMFQLSREQAAATFDGVPPEELGAAARREAARQIAGGIMRGYLAYADGLSIGWCNANDKSAYPINPALDAGDAASSCTGVKSVVCFEIAPEFRGKGVATALLQRVLEDAAAGGYTAVEGYPTARGERFEWDYTGPVRLYEKLGFTETSRQGERILMRKALS